MILQDVSRLTLRLFLRHVLEAEASEFLGRELYARGERARARHRNGHGKLVVKTTAGAVPPERPKVRGAAEPFGSRLLREGRKPHRRPRVAGDRLLRGGGGGSSHRDVGVALREALGPEATLLKSTLSRICRVLVAELEARRRRDISAVELDYLFLDACHFKLHPASSRAEPVLCARSGAADGGPHFLAPEAVTAERYDACEDFLRGLMMRGLRPPLLAVTDGAPGLLGAVEHVFRQSLLQRCLVHLAGNVLAKAPTADQDALKADCWSVSTGSRLHPARRGLRPTLGRALSGRYLPG